MKKQEVNKTYVMVASIIGVSILGFGLMQLENGNRAREESKKRYEMEQDQKIEVAREVAANQKRLEACLLDAEIEFQSDFELNSEPIEVEGKKDIRRWKSASLQERIEKQLSDSKEFCLKRFDN